MRKSLETQVITLEKIVNGGQTLGTLADGRKAFVWGGLPGEQVEVQITKKKSKMVEATVRQVITPSQNRIDPKDANSYLSTSPWQIINFDQEQDHKSQLIDEAFEQHHVTLPRPSSVFTDGAQYGYRNKVEFSWYSDKDAISGVDTLDLAFFRRGSRGKIVVDGTSLASSEINQLARSIRDMLKQKSISARQLKTLLIRSSRSGQATWQLYVKERLTGLINSSEASALPAIGGEIIYSDPRSPASVVTERLDSFGQTTLEDHILGANFRYATEGFFQINLPVYEKALTDIKDQLDNFTGDQAVVDMYSGVGTIGLTVTDRPVTLVEINEAAVTEMRRNVKHLGKNAEAVLAPSEKALDHITPDKVIIVDPPRAGLHDDVVERLLDQLPPRIIYLSCNPATQARDVALLLDKYQISHTQGYNFFPRTPHIENLIVLDKS